MDLAKTRAFLKKSLKFPISLELPFFGFSLRPPENNDFSFLQRISAALRRATFILPSVIFILRRISVTLRRTIFILPRVIFILRRISVILRRTIFILLRKCEKFCENSFLLLSFLAIGANNLKGLRGHRAPFCLGTAFHISG